MCTQLVRDVHGLSGRQACERRAGALAAVGRLAACWLLAWAVHPRVLGARPGLKVTAVSWGAWRCDSPVARSYIVGKMSLKRA